MCTMNLAKVRAKNLKEDATRVVNYLNNGEVEKAQYILKDILIVGGILATIIWYLKEKKIDA